MSSHNLVPNNAIDGAIPDDYNVFPTAKSVQTKVARRDFDKLRHLVPPPEQDDYLRAHSWRARLETIIKTSGESRSLYWPLLEEMNRSAGQNGKIADRKLTTLLRQSNRAKARGEEANPARTFRMHLLSTTSLAYRQQRVTIQYHLRRDFQRIRTEDSSFDRDAAAEERARIQSDLLARSSALMAGTTTRRGGQRSGAAAAAAAYVAAAAATARRAGPQTRQRRRAAAATITSAASSQPAGSTHSNNNCPQLTNLLVSPTSSGSKRQPPASHPTPPPSQPTSPPTTNQPANPPARNQQCHRNPGLGEFVNYGEDQTVFRPWMTRSPPPPSPPPTSPPPPPLINIE